MLAISKEKAELALDQLLKEKERTITHLNRGPDGTRERMESRKRRLNFTT